MERQREQLAAEREIEEEKAERRQQQQQQQQQLQAQQAQQSHGGQGALDQTRSTVFSNGNTLNSTINSTINSELDESSYSEDSYSQSQSTDHQQSPRAHLEQAGTGSSAAAGGAAPGGEGAGVGAGGGAREGLGVHVGGADGQPSHVSGSGSFAPDTLDPLDPYESSRLSVGTAATSVSSGGGGGGGGGGRDEGGIGDGSKDERSHEPDVFGSRRLGGLDDLGSTNLTIQSMEGSLEESGPMVGSLASSRGDGPGAVHVFNGAEASPSKAASGTGWDYWEGAAAGGTMAAVRVGTNPEFITALFSVVTARAGSPFSEPLGDPLRRSLGCGLRIAEKAANAAATILHAHTHAHARMHGLSPSSVTSGEEAEAVEAVEAGERLGAVLVPLLGLIDHLVERDHLMLSILSKQKAQAQAQAQAAGQAAGDAAGVVTDPSMDPAPDIVTQAVRVVAALLSLPQALSRSRGSSMEGPGANRSLLTDNMSRGSGGGGLGVLRGSNSSGLIGSQRMGASDRYVGPSVLQC